MKQVTVNIPDNKYSFFLELVKNLGLKPSEDVIHTTHSRKSFSAIKLKTKGFKFNRDEANER